MVRPFTDSVGLGPATTKVVARTRVAKSVATNLAARLLEHRIVSVLVSVASPQPFSFGCGSKQGTGYGHTRINTGDFALWHNVAHSSLTVRKWPYADSSRN